MTVRLDIGCGARKREGCIGIDMVAADGVDHVLDLQNDALPFDDRSVDEIFSSHCLEHLDSQASIFREISRVAKEGARLELWVPHAWSDEGFIYDHKTHFTKLHYLHPTWLFPEFWKEKILHSYWHLKEIRYAMLPRVLGRLARNRVRLDFALEHMVNIAWEFCVIIQVSHTVTPDTSAAPKLTFSLGRDGRSYPVRGWNYLVPLVRHHAGILANKLKC